jgi:site-specific recombinase XerD
VSATIRALRDDAAAGAQALAAVTRHLARGKLAATTVAAYRRQASAYVAWLAARPGVHPNAFADVIGAEAAVTAWRRALLAGKAAPATVNQAIAAVTLLYDHGARLRVKVKRVRVPKPGAPAAVTRTQENALRRAADRRGPRDAAIIAVLLGVGARAAECARLDTDDVSITARTGTVRLLGKGDEPRCVPVPAPARDRVSVWLDDRARKLKGTPEAGRLWWGQRGPLGVEGITKIVLAAGTDANISGLRPHVLRHTYATRLREGGADPAQIQYLLGHASLDTAARYFRASATEVAELVDRALDY